MNNEKKMAYIFDTKQMAVDFSIGALIGIIVPGAVARKVASNEAKNPVLDETRNSHINGNYGSPDKVDNLLSGRPELSGSSRDKLLTTVQNSELRKIVNELYRPGASVGDGGTAAILVEEFNNGSSTHLIKAIERLKQLRNLASSGKLGFNDLDVVEALIDDLEYAVSLFDWLEDINVSKNVREFFEKMQEFFPSTKNAYIESVEEYGEVLETVVIEDIFMPELLTLLAKNEDAELLSNIFNYFEEIIKKNDSHLINIFSVTVLEILGNDKAVLKVAKQYMGEKTTLLQMKADKELGRL